MREQLVVTGERVRLRTVRESDRARLIAIRSTPEVRARWRGDDLGAEFDTDLLDDEAQRLCIELQTTGEVVGLIQFGEEGDPEYRHASIDLYVDPAFHRQGLAFDAITALVAFLIDGGGHHRLIIDPAADNKAAIACYSKVGFRPVGIMRAYEKQADGTWGDGLLMDLLASDIHG